MMIVFMAIKNFTMKQFKHTLLLLCFTAFLSVFSVAQIAIGEWRDHLPYRRAVSVAEAGNTIYCATPYGLFYFDNSEVPYNLERLNKVNGLSDIGINRIAYNDPYNALLIAYENANIDLIKDNVIINISDIKRKPIIGNKTINNILYIDNLAYLACGFGIVVLDIDKEEFPEPVYYIGPEGSQINVLDITFGNDTLYAATEAGIYKASINNPNLADFTSWVRDERLYAGSMFNAIDFYNNYLVVNNDNEGYLTDSVFYYDFTSNLWYALPNASNSNKHSFKTKYGQLVLVSEGSMEVYNAELERTILIHRPGEVYLNARDATIDTQNNYWIADYNLGLIKSELGWDGEFISPLGPFSADVYDMAMEGESLWVVAGGRGTTWGKMYNRNGAYSFAKYNNDIVARWRSYNRATGYLAFDSISDLVCVAIDPSSTNRVMVGTWQQGVMEFVNDTLVEIYDDRNSSLEKWPAGNYVAVSGVGFDSKNNVWAVNSGANSLLSVMETDGEWTSFFLGSMASGSDVGKMLIDSYDQKWILMRSDHSLLVFTENGTIGDSNDDDVKILKNVVGNGDIPGTKIYSFAQDLDGELWLGTDDGIGVIYSPGNVFTGGNYDAQRILVEVGGYVQYLLESETVTAIAVDGDNRKWIGTEKAGVFLLSADGTEEIHHFTSEDSPLYSNTIIDIEVNGESGEVFMGTDKGIISYRSTATNGGPTNSNVVVYPNPVREGYQGTIAIKGLVNNADVKITDVSGNLIYATRAEGGQAVWDGKSFSGRKAKTGVYLVFSSDDEGKETIVTKILFLN